MSGIINGQSIKIGTVPRTALDPALEANISDLESNSGVSHIIFNPNNLALQTTTVDGQYSGLSILEPFQGNIMPIIGGISIPVGNAVKTEASYWTRDSGTTALSLTSLQVGDKLYWNGSIAGSQLSSSIKGSLLFIKQISGYVTNNLTETPHLLTLQTTTADGQYSGLSLSGTPYGNVMVVISSMFIPVGDGVKTEAAYWSRNSGVTALALSSLVQGDQLYWNGSIAGFELNSSTKGSLWYLY